MASKAEVRGSKGDTVKLAIALALVVGGAIAFYYYGEQPLVFRLLGMLAVVGASVGLALQTVQGRTAWDFVREARTEVRKVVWPTRAETVQTTLLVLVMVVIVSLILWAMDGILFRLVSWLVGQGE